MTDYLIALDVHCAFSEMAVVTAQGKLVRRERCETAIPALVERLSEVRRPRRLTFEEGPLADWLARELRSHVDELVVCEPRRNHWIAKDGDKDDPAGWPGLEAWRKARKSGRDTRVPVRAIRSAADPATHSWSSSGRPSSPRSARRGWIAVGIITSA